MTEEELATMFTDTQVPGLAGLPDDQRHRAQRVLNHCHHLAVQLVNETGGFEVDNEQQLAAVGSVREAAVHAIAVVIG